MPIRTERDAKPHICGSDMQLQSTRELSYCVIEKLQPLQAEWDRHLLQGSSHSLMIGLEHYIFLYLPKVKLIHVHLWTQRKMLFFVALCLYYFHPQIGIPDAKVTIITHLCFSKQFWRMQQIPKQKYATQNALFDFINIFIP